MFDSLDEATIPLQKRIGELEAECKRLDACRQLMQDKCTAEEKANWNLLVKIAELQADENLLVELWRSHDFTLEGEEGDDNHWTPARTAVEILKRQREQIKALQADKDRLDWLLSQEALNKGIVVGKHISGDFEAWFSRSTIDAARK